MKRSSGPKRRTPLRASGGPTKRTPITPKKRKPSEFARVYGSKARVAWVKSLACCWCKASAPSHNAHTVTGGMGRKAGYETIAPLCATCHAAYDEHRYPFQRAARDFVKGAASMVEELWQARLAASSGLTPLSSIVPGVVAAAEQASGRPTEQAS